MSGRCDAIQMCGMSGANTLRGEHADLPVMSRHRFMDDNWDPALSRVLVVGVRLHQTSEVVLRLVFSQPRYGPRSIGPTIASVPRPIAVSIAVASRGHNRLMKKRSGNFSAPPVSGDARRDRIHSPATKRLTLASRSNPIRRILRRP